MFAHVLPYAGNYSFEIITTNLPQLNSQRTELSFFQNEENLPKIKNTLKNTDSNFR